MKTSYIIAGIVVVMVVAGGVVWYSNSNSVSGSSSRYQQSPPQEAQPQVATPARQDQTAPAAAPATQSSTPALQKFTVNGNDNSADLTTITVPKGTPVTITFGADSNGTYHGGLDFRSSVVNTGTIVPGGTKAVNFVATQSFSFTPYWPSTNIAKPYKINVVVD